jgi:hypothetical protein
VAALTTGWRLPVLAGFLTLLAVVTVYFTVFYEALRPASIHQFETEYPTLMIEEYETAGRSALARRDFAEAAELFRRAREVYERRRTAVPASRGRRLMQLHRQVELLVSRCPPLEQSLSNWATLDGEDLDRVFAAARGQAVFFDLEMLRWDGQYQYERRLGPNPQPLKLHELKLLNRLPLQNARQRVVFAARLAGLRRDAQDRFIVSFHPDSGVLVTDEEVAQGPSAGGGEPPRPCCLAG